MGVAGFLIATIKVCYVRMIVGFTEMRINRVNELCSGVGRKAKKTRHS